MNALRWIAIFVCLWLMASLLYGLVDPGAAQQAHSQAMEAFGAPR